MSNMPSPGILEIRIVQSKCYSISSTFPSATTSGIFFTVSATSFDRQFALCIGEYCLLPFNDLFIQMPSVPRERYRGEGKGEGYENREVMVSRNFRLSVKVTILRGRSF